MSCVEISPILIMELDTATGNPTLIIALLFLYKTDGRERKKKGSRSDGFTIFFFPFFNPSLSLSD